MKAKYWGAKIAFEIPKECEKEINECYPGEIGLPKDLVNDLMDLFKSATYESENICTPYLIIVDVDTQPSQRWISDSLRKIDKILKKRK
jgi:hypothetical protein